MQFIYLVMNGHGIIKIGKADNVRKRIRSMQTGNPWTISVLHTIEVPDEHAFTIERLIHKRMKRYHINGEWFRAKPNIARRIAVRAAAQYARDQIAAYPEREQAFAGLASQNYHLLPK